MRKVLRVMDSSGDTRVEFDETDAGAVAEAKALFERVKAKGDAVFVTSEADRRAGSFEELGAENLIVPKIIGG